MADPITIVGLREFRAAVRAAETGSSKMVRIALNDAANVVVDDARPRVPTRTGRARRSVRAKSTGTKARVAGGGGRAPYYPWLDFGGRVGRDRSIKRTFKTRGRYLYAAYFKARDSGEFQEVMTDSLLAVARKSGLDVTAK